MSDFVELIKENNLAEIEKMSDLKPETKEIMIEYVNKFYILPSKMVMTDYNNDIYIRLMKDAIEDDIPITYEDIEKEFSNVIWDTAK